MYDVAYSIICGRVSVDPEIRTTDEGKQIASFSVAVNVNKDKVNFYSVTAFGAIGKYAKEQLSKGVRVTVMGKTEQCISKEGKAYVRMIADTLFPGVYKPLQNDSTSEEESIDYV